MPLFTSLCKGSSRLSALIVFWFLFSSANLLLAQGDTNTGIPSPGEISLDRSIAATNAPATNSPSAISPTPSVPAIAPATPSLTEAPSATSVAPVPNVPRSILGALMTLASLGGFLLYHCGLTRAKNSGHTSTLLLVGVLFGLTGYWIGGFAVQTGGVGDAHAALAQPILPAERSALDHELGPMVFGHHWGLMGSAGFFLATDDSARDGIAMLFLIQAAALAIALAAALGAALERGKLLSMAFCAYLIGVLVYPLLANWAWGGGWLAELGREFGLGHGFVDLGGSGVVHQTAGTMALVIAVVLGPRHGRFGRNKPSYAIPGHNVPFVVLGSVVLLVSWMATNAFACASLVSDPLLPGAASSAGLAAINTLLAAAGGLVISFIQAAWQRRRPEPARLCRGLLGGAVASCGGAGLIDPWAAFLIGGVAGLLVQEAMVYLERKRIDDPVGAAAVHGVGGAWGVVAVGLFANGTEGHGLNGVTSPGGGVRGLFFGGAWHQLAAQVIGCVTGFVVVCLLGYACVSLVQKILGNRVALTHETGGLDWPEVGALGYQGDAEPEDSNGKS
jgi:Amt family ammonium transporter